MDQIIFTKFPELRAKREGGPVYICKCGDQFVKSKQRFMKHVEGCTIFKSVYYERATQCSLISSSNRLGPFSEQQSNTFSEQNDERIINLQKSVQDLSARLLKLGPHQKNIIQKENQSQFFAGKLLQNIKSSVLQILKIGLISTFRELIEMKVRITDVYDQIRRGLIQELNGIDFLALIDKFPQKLSQFHQLLIKQKQSCDQRTKDRYDRGFKFWKKFKSLRNYGLIIQQLKMLSKNGRNEAMLYYNAMKTNINYNFPIIPQGMVEKKKYIKQAPLNLDQLKKTVNYLLMNNKSTLAVDFWFITCLGLRKRQLRKVYLQSKSSGECFDYIKIFQYKNKNWIIRPIPQSLKQLVAKYKISYPITDERIEKMQRVAKLMNRRFYGYRSSCITGLVTAFSATSLRTHQSASTTANYYVNSQSKFFIDNVFSLEFLSGEEVISDSDLFLKLDQNQNYNEIKGDFSDLLISFKQLFEEQDQQLQQAAISKEQDIVFEQVQQIQLKYISLVQHLFQTYSLNIASQKYLSIQQCLDFALEDRKFYDCLRKFKLEKLGNINMKQFIKEVYDVKLEIITFNSQFKLQAITQEYQITKDKLIVINVVKQNESFFFVCDNQVKWNSTKKRRQIIQGKAINYNEKQQFFKFSSIMNCNKCNGTLVSVLDDQCYFIRCQNNHNQSALRLKVMEKIKQHEKGSELLFQCNDIKVFQPKFKACNFKSQKNNFQETILGELRTYANKYTFLSTCPKRLKTTNSPYNDMAAKLIRQNTKMEQYLPLVIKPSEGKGKGIFAQQIIKKNTLIMSYLGQVGTNQNLMVADDTTFTLGHFIDQGGHIKDLIVIGRDKTNSCRYINSSSTPQLSNIRPQICWIPCGDRQLYQIRIIYVSKRDIQPNQELLSFYNDYLWSEEFELQKDKRKNIMPITQNVFMAEYKNAAAVIINQYFLSFPLQFKFSIRAKAIHCDKYEKFLNSVSKNIDIESENYGQIQNNLLLSNFNPDLQHKVNLFLKSKPKSKISFIGQVQLLSSLIAGYPQPTISKNLQILSMSFDNYIPVLGDGSCLYRSLIYSLLCSSNIAQIQQHFFSKPQHYIYFSGQINLQLNDIYNIFLKKITSMKAQPNFKENVRKFWNGSNAFDKIICARMKQKISSQILSKYGQYYELSSNLQKDFEQILMEDKDAPDITVKAASQVFKIRINIYIVSPNGVSLNKFGERYTNEVSLFLRSQHYQILIERQLQDRPRKYIKLT